MNGFFWVKLFERNENSPVFEFVFRINFSFDSAHLGSLQGNYLQKQGVLSAVWSQFLLLAIKRDHDETESTVADGSLSQVERNFSVQAVGCTYS